MRVLPLALSALAVAGCHSPVQFSDDVDLAFDFLPFVPDFDADTLHTPYVRGAPVTVYAHPRAGIDADALEVESADPDVFEILAVEQDGDDLRITGVATGAGETEIVVNRRGRDLDAAFVEVGFPTRAELHPAGPLFVGIEGDEPRPRLLAGGLATFQVQYFDGDRRLWGNAVLAATAAQGLDVAAVEQTWLFENREWLQVEAPSAGTASVDLSVDGELLGPVAFDVVESVAIDEIAIHGSDETGARDGDWEVLLAQAYDADGQSIFGIDYAWEIDGVLQPGLGDLYRYQFERGAGTDVRASFLDRDASVTANVGEGYVDSSNNLGCATGAGLPTLAWVVGLAATRRYRGRGRGEGSTG